MNETSEFGLSAIAQIAVVAHNIGAMRDFYRDKLGMKLLFQVPNMAFFDCGGIRLMLSPPSSSELNHPASIIYFKVNDIKQAFEVLSVRGVKFEREPGITAQMESSDLWVAFLRDPENNILALMSEVQRT